MTSMQMPTFSYRISQRTVNTTVTRDAKHSSQRFLLLFMVSSNHMLSVSRHMYSLVKGSAVLLPPNTPYSFSFGGVSSYYRISFLPEDLYTQSLLQKMTEEYRIMILPDSITGESMFWTIRQLFELSHHPNQLRAEIEQFHEQILIRKLMLDMLTQQMVLSRKIDKSDNVESLHVRIQHFLQDHYTEQITLDDLEAVFFHSKYYLSHLFQQKTGMTIIEYLNAERVRHACDLLTDENLLIKDICHASGFRTTQHFFNVFQKMTGLTPAKYRKEYWGTF